MTADRDAKQGNPIALEDRDRQAARLFSPSAARNRDPILAVLQAHLPPVGKALEISSGTGEHVVHFARHLPSWTWQPSEFAPDSLHSISAWIETEGLGNVAQPLLIDSAATLWGVEDTARFDLIFSANMIHIAPWNAAIGLFRGAGRLLSAAGVLLLYGPFKNQGVHTSQSNQDFDHSLRARNPAWGVRDLADLQVLATENGLVLQQRIGMPANNQCLLFARV